jgi:hypothetical protein
VDRRETQEPDGVGQDDRPEKPTGKLSRPGVLAERQQGGGETAWRSWRILWQLRQRGSSVFQCEAGGRAGLPRPMGAISLAPNGMRSSAHVNRPSITLRRSCRLRARSCRPSMAHRHG